MKREALEDYDREAREEQKMFIRKSRQGDFSSCRSYFWDRFHNPSLPISKLHASTQGSKGLKAPIWNFVPLSRTLVVPIIPTPEQALFEALHGFKIDKIPEIVEYVKEEGRIQFVLRSFPLEYERLDFLDPILVHLRPPTALGIQPEAYFDPKQVKKHRAEFYELAGIKYIPYLHSWSLDNFGTINPAHLILEDLSVIYTYLRALGYEQLVDRIQEALIPLDREGFYVLMEMGKLLGKPLSEPLDTLLLGDVDFRKMRSRFFETGVNPPSNSFRPAFPGEIGRLLFRKLIHATPTLESARQLTYHYEEEDVYKVGHALNEGIQAGKPEIVKEQSEEISAILEDLWADKSVSRRVIGVKVGIKILFAAIGAVTQGISGLGTGLLASFGFDIADKLFKFKDEAISEKIGKSFSSNYETILYDFKKKYPLTASDKKL